MKVNIEEVEKKIVSVQYTKMGRKMTVCLITVENGHEFIGQAGCVDPENYDLEIGSKWAYKDAFDKLVGAEAYLLQEKLNIDNE